MTFIDFILSCLCNLEDKNDNVENLLSFLKYYNEYYDLYYALLDSSSDITILHPFYNYKKTDKLKKAFFYTKSKLENKSPRLAEKELLKKNGQKLFIYHLI